MKNSHKILGTAALSVLTAAATLFPASNAEAAVVVRAPVIVRAPVMVRPPVVSRPVAPIAPRYTPQVSAAHLPAAGGHGGGNKLPPVNGATATGGGGSGGNSGGNSGGGNRLPNKGQNYNGQNYNGQSSVHSTAAPQYYSSGGSYVPYSNPWFPYYVMPHSSHAASTPQPLSQQDRGQPVSSGVETRHFVCEPKANESGFNYVRRCETRNSAKAKFHMQVRLGCQPAGETAQSWLQRCAVQQIRP